MNMPRIHPREQVVTRSRLALEAAVIQWAGSDAGAELTDAEYVSTVAAVLSSRLTSWAKYAIRSERHPDDPDQPGGWE